MKNVVRLFSMMTLVLGFTLAAHGQATRTWVSGVGDDVNPCSRTAPCKTFQGAISKTAAGGEISVLDPGGFGAVTITKSLTIDGKGQIASILASGTNGITVNALTTDKIYIRNLEINGGNTALNGIRILNAGSVTVENTAIFNIATGNLNHGVVINTATAMEVHLENVTIRNVGGMGVIATSTVGNKVKLVVNNSRIIDCNQSAIDLDANVDAIVTNSTMTHTFGAGVFVECVGCVADVYNSVLSKNGFGVHVGAAGGGTVRLYGSQITQNTTDGIRIIAPAVVNSHGNNAIVGNSGTQAVSANIGQQ